MSHAQHYEQSNKLTHSGSATAAREQTNRANNGTTSRGDRGNSGGYRGRGRGNNRGNRGGGATVTSATTVNTLPVHPRGGNEQQAEKYTP